MSFFRFVENRINTYLVPFWFPENKSAINENSILEQIKKFFPLMALENFKALLNRGELTQ